MELELIGSGRLEEFLIFSRKVHDDSAFSEYPFSEKNLRTDIDRRIADSTVFNCLCVHDDKIIGAFLADLGKFRQCDVLFGMESGFYVLPEYRGSRAALLMVNSFFGWCRDHNAVPFMEIYYGDDNEKTYKFCSKIGMIERGRIFIGVKNGVHKQGS